MSEQGQDKATALVPVAQRRVKVLDGDEVLAVRAEDGSIYLPLRPICASLGLSYQPQRRRIQRDSALEDGMREIRLQTGGGRQATACMALNLVGSVKSWLPPFLGPPAASRPRSKPGHMSSPTRSPAMAGRLAAGGPRTFHRPYLGERQGGRPHGTLCVRTVS